MPSISVIVPVYQAEKFLRDCVESVRRQTFSDWELLLVDDGCTDGSPALCDELAREDDRIRVFHKERNSGVSETRNVGLDHVRGPISPFWTPTISTSPSAWRRCGTCGSGPGRIPPPVRT